MKISASVFREVFSIHSIGNSSTRAIRTASTQRRIFRPRLTLLSFICILPPGGDPEIDNADQKQDHQERVGDSGAFAVQEIVEGQLV